MPFWAWLFSSEVKSMVDKLDERVIVLEHEVKEFKKIIKRHNIQ